MWNPDWDFPMFGLRSPAMDKPLYDVRNTGDVLIEIAKGLGGSVARSFPWKDFQEALKDAIKGVFAVETRVDSELKILTSSGMP